jgi:hypothetical protein
MVSSSGVAGVRDAGEADAGDFGLQRNTGRLNKQTGLKLGLPKDLPIRSVAG